jgi:hypothetical protein
MRLVTAAFACALLAGLAAAPLGASDPWAKLRRPLHLPRLASGGACPISRVDERIDWSRAKFPGSPGIGRGPVYPGLGSTDGVLTAEPDTQYGGPWAGQKVFWYVRASYRGRALIRGRRLDGPQRLGFDGGRLPVRELRLDRGVSVGWDTHPPGSRGIASIVRVHASGCYGVQIDGTSFSRVVVFRVEAPS